MSQASQESQATLANPISHVPEIWRLEGMSQEQKNATYSLVTSRFETYVQLFDKFDRVWPTCTDEMCRWCMHRFTWFPIGIPVRFDERRHKMVLSGYFCSFACACAFVKDHPTNSIYTHHSSWLLWLAQRAFGLPRILRAPPRELLNRYTIEQFRSLSGEVAYDDTSMRGHYERENEIITTRRLVDANVESESVRAKEIADHAQTVAHGGGKRRKQLPPALNESQSQSSNYQLPQTQSMLPPQSVRLVMTNHAEKREKTGILSMLGATRKPR